jgi:hypothetical protein
MKTKAIQRRSAREGGSTLPLFTTHQSSIRLQQHGFAVANHLSLFPSAFGAFPFSSEKVWDRLSPDKFAGRRYNFAVSASEIIKELPKLSEAERRAIREGLLEIANQHPDVALCNQAALDGALMLDRMEDEDAWRQSR